MDTTYETLLPLIKDIHLFQEIDKKSVRSIIEKSAPKKLNIGQTLFRQDEKARSVFLVLNGRLKLVQINRNGDEVIHRYIGAGEFAAITATLNNQNYPVSGISVQNGLILCWSGTALREIMLTFPQVSINILSDILVRFQDIQHRYHDLCTIRVEQRIARALLRLMNQGGKKTEIGVEITFPLKRQDIAELTGTTLFTVSRLLSTWEKKGWIISSREKVIITDIHSLVTMAEDIS